MAHADIIVPRGGENKVAIHLIVQHVHTQLQLVSPRILIKNKHFYSYINFVFLAWLQVTRSSSKFL